MYTHDVVRPKGKKGEFNTYRVDKVDTEQNSIELVSIARGIVVAPSGSFLLIDIPDVLSAHRLDRRIRQIPLCITVDRHKRACNPLACFGLLEADCFATLSHAHCIMTVLRWCSISRPGSRGGTLL